MMEYYEGYSSPAFLIEYELTKQASDVESGLFRIQLERHTPDCISNTISIN